MRPDGAVGAPTPAERARAVLHDSVVVYSEAEVARAIDRMAAEVTARFADCDPLLLAVLNGGMWTTTHLAARLAFPYAIDGVHATRYGGAREGGALQWRTWPQTPLEGRTVLLVDDILDEGVTLAALLEACRDAGAAQVASAVLVDKRHERRQPGVSADIRGLEVDDVYVFGCGMDVDGYWRGLNALHAVGSS